MEAVKQSLTDMMVHFTNQMSAFESELKKTPAAVSSGSNPTTGGLAAEFYAFRTYIMSAVQLLQQQVEMLARETDQLEMRGRRKILLVHGVAEVPKEDTSAVVVKLVADKLGVEDFTCSGIGRCHRMGRPADDHCRPILVKFKDITVRDSAWFAKKKLKGSGTTLSEFLTKRRHDAFMAARDRFGVKKCWTRDGMVHIEAPDGSRHRVVSKAELSSIPSSAAASTSSPAAAEPVASEPVAPAAETASCSGNKTRRAALERPVRSTRK